MLTKAIIESLPGSNSNKFLIRIPVLAKAGITNDFMRASIGLENIDDIIEDIENAIKIARS